MSDEAVYRTAPATPGLLTIQMWLYNRLLQNAGSHGPHADSPYSSAMSM